MAETELHRVKSPLSGVVNSPCSDGLDRTCLWLFSVLQQCTFPAFPLFCFWFLFTFLSFYILPSCWLSTGGAAAAPICSDPFHARAADSCRGSAGSSDAASPQAEAAFEQVPDCAAELAAPWLHQGSGSCCTDGQICSPFRGPFSCHGKAASKSLNLFYVQFSASPFQLLSWFSHPRYFPSLSS